MKRNETADEGCRGSAVLYAVFLASLLAVISLGYMAAGIGSKRELAGQMRWGQAQAAARSLHQSFCRAVSEGSSEAMNQIWDCFMRDCSELLNAYEEMEEEESETEDWETFLREEMEGREYTSVGEGGNGKMKARILLEAFPFDGRAYVHTQVEWEAFTICLGGEIHFDNERGRMRALPGFSGKEKICLTGDGVYRYWEEGR